MTTTVSPVGGISLATSSVQNPTQKIDKSVCALTEEEEREVLSTRNVQRKRDLIDLGKERATAISLVNNYFDAPIEDVLQELSTQRDNNLKERVESSEAPSSEDALYICSSICNVQRLALACAYATIRQYTYVHDPENAGRYFYEPNGSTINLDEVIRSGSGSYEELFSIASKAIESLKEVNENTLAEVLKK